MADIQKAYQFLNKSLGLKLSLSGMQRIEMLFKQELARKKGFELSEEDADSFGLFVYFQPRKGVKLSIKDSKTPKSKAK